MPWLFSYGTLQQEEVQLVTFGRRLVGVHDALPGAELSRVLIRDPDVVRTTGMTHYANVLFTGKRDSHVHGVALEVSDAELAAADEYERDASYERIRVTLASGRQAWVYVCGAAEPRR